MKRVFLTLSVCLSAFGQAPKTTLSVLLFPNNDTTSITNCGPGQPCIGGQSTVYGGTTIVNWADIDVDGTAANYDWSKPDAAIELWSGFGKFTVVSIAPGNPTVMTLSRPPNPALSPGSIATVSGGTGTGCGLLSYTNAAVNSVSGSTITLAINTTGCTYTAKSAMLDYKFGGFGKKTNLILWGVGYSGQNPPAYVAGVTNSIQIVSVTATNPAVLTLASVPSPAPMAGTAVKIAGASGTGCSLNGDAQVTAVSGASITVAVNAVGCVPIPRTAEP